MLPVYALLEMLASFAASLWVSILGLVYGTIQVLIPRAQNQPFTRSGESTWSFGQLVPLILLVQPFGMLMEFVYPDELDKAEIKTRYGPQSLVAQLRKGQPGEVENFSDTTLVACLSEHPSSDERSRDHERARIKRVLFKSRLFTALVWLIQFTIIGTGALVFTWDAASIGNSSTSNWATVLYASLGLIGVSVVLGAVCAPFSRLGRFQGADTTHLNASSRRKTSRHTIRGIKRSSGDETKESTSPSTIEMNPWRRRSDPT